MRMNNRRNGTVVQQLFRSGFREFRSAAQRWKSLRFVERDLNVAAVFREETLTFPVRRLLLKFSVVDAATATVKIGRIVLKTLTEGLLRAKCSESAK